MSHNDRGNGGHGLLMFLLGTTAGAVVALLSAPGTGADTRRRLQGTLKQVRNKVSSVSGSVADSFSRGTVAIKDALKSPSQARQSYNGSLRN